MARARIEAGWVVIDVPGVDPLIPVSIGVAGQPPEAAFRDGAVARVQLPSGLQPGRPVPVVLEVSGHSEKAGNLQV